MWFFSNGDDKVKKKYVVKDKREFNEIIKKSKFIKNNYFVIYIRKNNLDISRFGIAVSKKIGKAHFRNKLKRRIRNIIDNNNYLFKKSYDYIIMIKRGKDKYDYQTLEKEVKNILKKGALNEK